MPVCGEREKGKGGDGHQGNRLYSYSTYVLKSIHKRCSTVFLVAGRVQAAAEKAHSRKPEDETVLHSPCVLNASFKRAAIATNVGG